MPKILFIQPTQRTVTGELCKQKKLYFPGLVFPYLAALTPDHWEVEIILEVLEDIDYNTDADIIGIGGMGHAIYRSGEIALEFKKRGKTICFGGYMTSLFPEALETYADTIIIGDAEISYPLMLKDFENGCLKKVYNNPISDMNNLPLPKYELFRTKNVGMLPVQAGRGCPFTCKYCSIASLYKGKYMQRPVDEVIRDVWRIKELGFNKFVLVDDNIVSNQQFFKTLCRKLIPLKMNWVSQCALSIAKNPELLTLAAKSGCKLLNFGIETINQQGLSLMDKTWIKVNEYKDLLRNVYKAGILPGTEMIIGLDGDTIESIKKTYQFIMDLQLPVPKFYILTPIPGTKLFYEYREQNRLLHEDFTQYTGTRCVHKMTTITPEELTQMYKWLVNKVFSYHSIIKRTLFNKYFFKTPELYLSSFGINLVYRKYVKKGEVPNIF